jgi:hypothetical protein
LRVGAGPVLAVADAPDLAVALEVLAVAAVLFVTAAALVVATVFFAVAAVLVVAAAALEGPDPVLAAVLEPLVGVLTTALTFTIPDPAGDLEEDAPLVLEDTT